MFRQKPITGKLLIIDLAFILLVLTQPLDAQGFYVGLVVSVSIITTILFTAVGIVALQPTKLDTADKVFVGFLYLSLISLLISYMTRGPDVVTSDSITWSAWRPLVQFIRWAILGFLFYKVVKNYFGSGLQFDARQSLFNRSLLGLAGWLALYGSYQFIAHYFRLPFAHLNTLFGTQEGYSTYYFLSSVEDPLAGLVRLHATFGEPKIYAGFLLILLPLLSVPAYQYWQRRRDGLRFLLPPFIFVLLMIQFLLTFARSGYIAALVGLIGLALLFGQKRTAFVITAVALTMYIVAGGLFGGIPLDRLVTMLPDSVAEDLANRGWYSTLFQEAISIWLSNPWLGCGMGRMHTLGARVDTFTRTGFLVQSSKALLGNLLAENGIFAAFLFCVFWFWHLRRTFMSLRLLSPDDEKRLQLVASGTAVLVFGFFGLAVQWVPYSLFWLALGHNAALNDRILEDVQSKSGREVVKLSRTSLQAKNSRL